MIGDFEGINPIGDIDADLFKHIKIPPDESQKQLEGLSEYLRSGGEIKISSADIEKYMKERK